MSPQMVKRQMSRGLRIGWWAFVAPVTAATLLITAAAVGIADWLDARIGLVGVLVGGGVVLAAFLWIARRLDD
jgi:hypothetical protein